MSRQDLYQKACDAVERGNYDYAIELFREVLRREPQRPDARIALRGTERRRRQEKGRSLLGTPVRVLLTALKALFAKSRKKLEIYEDFLQTNPNSFWALMRAATAARKSGFQNEAIDIYKDALRVKPDSKVGLRTLSDILREADQNEEGLKYLVRLAALEPRNRDLQSEVRNLEATYHMAAHQLEGASSFRDLIRDQDEASQLEASGRMAVTMADLHEQLALAEKELAEQPQHAGRALNLAQLYVDTGQPAKAEQLLREKHDQIPDSYDIREKLGDVQIANYEQALAAAAQRIEENPQDAETRKKKEELEQRTRAFAISEYSWRIEQHPTDRELQFRLARAHWQAGMYNEAIAGFQTLARDARYAVESAKMLGLCFMGKRQLDLALEQFQHAIELHPDMDDKGKELLYCQGQVYEEMGNTEEALKVYKRVYSQDINFRDVARKVDTLGT